MPMTSSDPSHDFPRASTFQEAHRLPQQLAFADTTVAHESLSSNHHGPGVAQVATPKLELQPWASARDFFRWLGNNTTGVARVDLRRPTPPQPDQYDAGNILLARKPRPATWAPGGRRSGHTDRRGAYPEGGMSTSEPPRQTGARIKITRNAMMFKDPEGKRKPLIDIGLGVSVEMDSARLQPVARLKIRDLVSIKACPLGVVKISKCLPIGSTGMSAKILYELPISHIASFWTPPARLMVRLDNTAGSGLHLSPTGIEFDEKLVRFGSNLSVRAALGFTFPRSLPLDWENDDVGFKVHRLSLKSLW